MCTFYVSRQSIIIPSFSFISYFYYRYLIILSLHVPYVVFFFSSRFFLCSTHCALVSCSFLAIQFIILCSYLYLFTYYSMYSFVYWFIQLFFCLFIYNFVSFLSIYFSTYLQIFNEFIFDGIVSNLSCN